MRRHIVTERDLAWMFSERAKTSYWMRDDRGTRLRLRRRRSRARQLSDAVSDGNGKRRARHR